ncbi:MAG: AI-2E family transporter, partial [Gammaproteobacteria bacterium]|nr:AI-2E family transporter [Gammaproteobacteria bacterium]
VKWCSQFAPRKRSALNKVWVELNRQIGNYVRGKVVEAIIVGLASYVGFLLLGLEYSALLAVGVGLAVFVPYVGAVLATIPVVIVGLLQWGITAHFWYLLIVYTVINTLDGTVLTAILYSNTNALHPAVIIIATLVFGGIWGFWGVFFAIPLASLLKALMAHWPVTEDHSQ